MRKHKFTLVIAMLLPIVAAHAQNEDPKSLPYINNQFCISAKYVKYSGSHSPVGLSFETLYGFNNWLEAGAYIDGKILERSGYYGINYAIEAKAHLFALLADPSFYYADLYGIGRLGVSTHHLPNYSSSEGDVEAKNWSSFYHSLGIGAAVNFSRHFGFCYELNCFPFYANKMLNHSFGIQIRFGGPKKWRNTRQ